MVAIIKIIHKFIGHLISWTKIGSQEHGQLRLQNSAVHMLWFVIPWSTSPGTVPTDSPWQKASLEWPCVYRVPLSPWPLLTGPRVNTVSAGQIIFLSWEQNQPVVRRQGTPELVSLFWGMYSWWMCWGNWNGGVQKEMQRDFSFSLYENNGNGPVPDDFSISWGLPVLISGPCSLCCQHPTASAHLSLCWQDCISFPCNQGTMQG